MSPSNVYSQLQKELVAVFEGERDWIANCANCAALLYQTLPELNWSGFYYLRGTDLVLGPFQGKPACVRISLGKGVCGTAAQQLKTILVPDVHEFPGHIACDAASRSEIVIPLVQGARLVGVLDLDSPRVNRFSTEDSTGLESIVRVLLESSDV